MRELLDLERYPLDRPGSPQYAALVARCRAALRDEGLFSLDGLVRGDAMADCAAALRPLFGSVSFTHRRQHNVYFQKQMPGLAADHPALRLVETSHQTLCADQIGSSLVVQLYEWPPLAAFLAEVLEMPGLHTMADPLARVNVMCYRAGEGLNWHFDRSHFTTTLLIQAPETGGELEHRHNLRTAEDPNYDGVARVLNGQDPAVRTLALTPGTLNVFLGKNTLHRVKPPEGARERIIAIFSYYDRPGVRFSAEEQLGFYGRVA